MVYGFVDYYTSKKVKVEISGIQHSDLDKLTKKVMGSTGIKLAENYSHVPTASVNYPDYDIILTPGGEFSKLPETSEHKLHHLDLNVFKSAFEESEKAKSDYKNLRKKIQHACENFVEEFIEGDHLRSKKRSA